VDRDSARRRGYDKAHAKWRLAVLDRDPICKLCRRYPATVADHITPIRRGGARFDPANGQGLCAPCHNGAKQSFDRTGQMRGCDELGWPIDPNHHWRKP
jgi:5-methylcytosine-specific restriction enzyme A